MNGKGCALNAATGCQCNQLVPETDTEHWQLRPSRQPLTRQTSVLRVSGTRRQHNQDWLDAIEALQPFGERHRGAHDIDFDTKSRELIGQYEDKAVAMIKQQHARHLFVAFA